MSKSIGGGGQLSRVRPISPDQVEGIRQRFIPNDVIAAFNKLIVKNMNTNGEAIVLQEDVIKLICSSMATEENPYNEIKEKIFANKWLDVESMFREAGWFVDYDKPAYCDSYEPRFIFRKSK